MRDVQKNSGLNLEHVFSQTWEHAKAYYYLLQIGHLLMQLLHHNSLHRALAKQYGQPTVLGLWGAPKKIPQRWLEALRYYFFADADKRRQNLATVTDGLALADVIGARCCVDIAGSFNPTVWYGPHPENLSPKFFEAAVENARKIIDAVKPKRAKLSYEMMGWAIPDSPDSYVKLIHAVDREAFAVHLDVCNMVNSPEKFYHNTELINESFNKLGRWIVSCHAKDLTWDVEMNVHFREVRPGTGSIDYATYLRRLAQLPSPPPLMIEHLSKPEEYDQARQHILDTGKTAGLTFG
jgi:L-ribulose-5-phosphate 3-epimerase UlaE